MHTELEAATAERSVAAAMVAVPCARDNADLETVAHSSIQALIRVSEIAGSGSHAIAHP